MEKIVESTMDENKNIIISVTGTNKYVIPGNDRKLNAKSIYDVLDYSEGDKYTYVDINIDGKDGLVLTEIKTLLKSITDQVSQITFEEKDLELNKNLEDKNLKEKLK